MVLDKKIVMNAGDREDIYRWTIGDSDFENLPRDVNELPFGFMYGFTKVEFQKAYRKNAEKMTFKIKNIIVVNGLDTDLHCEGEVFDIELGDRIDE